MPISGEPCQQATPRAIRAMPATRAVGMATPVNSSPNDNWPTSDGTISNADPVAASPTAAKISTFFIDRWLRLEFERQPVYLAGELEGGVIAILQQRDAGARVLADIEGFVLRERDWGGVFQRIPGHFPAVHEQHAGAALAQSWAVGLEIEHDGMLAWPQFGAFPHRALQ